MRYLDSNTTPVENIAQSVEFIQFLIGISRKSHERREDNIVNFHKLCLGHHHDCAILGSESRRFWIWKLKELFILVNNHKGVCLEVPPDTSPERVWELVKMYGESMYGSSE
jgi:hypothetical protein